MNAIARREVLICGFNRWYCTGGGREGARRQSGPPHQLGLPRSTNECDVADSQERFTIFNVAPDNEPCLTFDNALDFVAGNKFAQLEMKPVYIKSRLGNEVGITTPRQKVEIFGSVWDKQLSVIPSPNQFLRTTMIFPAWGYNPAVFPFDFLSFASLVL